MNSDCLAVLRRMDRGLMIASALSLAERAGATTSALLCDCKVAVLGVTVRGCPRAVARLVLAPAGFAEEPTESGEYDHPHVEYGQREYRLWLSAPDACRCEIPF